MAILIVLHQTIYKLMNLRKSTSLILALFLLVSNMGFAFNVHFCGGKVSSISAAYKTSEVCALPKRETTEKKCCAKKAEEGKKCCSDKKVELKKKSEQVVVKTFSFHSGPAVIFQDWKPEVFGKPLQAPKQENIEYYCDANAPPLFKLYSQYIFYA